MKTPDIVIRGENNGDGMIVRYRTARGTDIFGLAVPNIHANSDWDLGPTWCYLVLGHKTTLVDTGRFGNFEVLGSLLKHAGKRFSDIERIIITHGHEDHDGNLAEVLAATQAELWAHSIYLPMITYHPHVTDGAKHPELPGSCRTCDMPEGFYRNCLPYHKKRSSLDIDFAIEDGSSLPSEDLSFVFTPGHTPDSICIALEDEVLFAGDTVLPDISPHPTLAHAFQVNWGILPESYRERNTVYGLMNYIRSLSKVAKLASQPFRTTFPAHRLFYGGRFNIIHSSSGRAKEIIRFHIERCRDIMRIAGKAPSTPDDIVVQHFPPSLLAGTGKLLARNEVIAHLEVMQDCGDVRWAGGDGDIVQNTGTDRCVAVMESYLD